MPNFAKEDKMLEPKEKSDVKLEEFCEYDDKANHPSVEREQATNAVPKLQNQNGDLMSDDVNKCEQNLSH